MSSKSPTCPSRYAPFCLLVLLIACVQVPAHEIHAGPDYIRAGVDKGDRITVVPIERREIAMKVRFVNDEAIVGRKEQVPFDQIASLSIRDWDPRVAPCGGDEALGCSDPQVLTLLSPQFNQPFTKFHEACTQHDFCSRHRAATYGLDREACDDDFYETIKSRCHRDGMLALLDARDVATCRAAANQSHHAARRYGDQHDPSDDSTVCEYGPKIVAAETSMSADEPTVSTGYRQQPSDLVAGEVMALAYSGYREGQHPDRGSGAKHPTDEQVLEDLKILVAHGFSLIRMYDAGEHTQTALRLIHEHGLPIRVLLGMWLSAEVSNHEGCPWLDEPIPPDVLAANTRENAAEIERGVALANRYPEIVVAVNVGNEALVDWNDHMVTRDAMIDYVRKVRAAIAQPVTVADNYAWWMNEGAPLAAEVDFIGVHTYPAWEQKPIEEGLAYTIENIEGVRAALPSKPIAVLEGGWATTASEFGERASEANQARYYREVLEWAQETNTTFFFFEAFDEPWKGDPNNPLGAEKHWGIFFVDRTPKAVMAPGD